MNRSAVREFQAPDIRVQRGELLVPTRVGDPARGSLPCPAAPLIAGSLRRKGWRCVLGPVPALDDAGADGGGAAVYLATCGQRGGGTAALAAAASPADRLAAAAAQAAVEEWAGVTGTRLLLAASSPWCSGAMRALDAAWNAAAEAAGQGRVMHLYGDLAAPPEARADLAARGVTAATALDDMAAGDIVVIPAHGVPPAVLAEAAARGLTVIDATCPLVTQAQEQAARLADRGDDVVLIGQAAGAAAGITSRAPDRATLVETAAGTAALQVADARRVSYLLQPGLPVESTAAVAAALRSRFPAARGPHPDSFCYAPSDRAQTVRAIAAGCDLMLVLGDPRQRRRPAGVRPGPRLRCPHPGHRRGHRYHPGPAQRGHRRSGWRPPPRPPRTWPPRSPRPCPGSARSAWSAARWSARSPRTTRPPSRRYPPCRPRPPPRRWPTTASGWPDARELLSDANSGGLSRSAWMASVGRRR